MYNPIRVGDKVSNPVYGIGYVLRWADFEHVVVRITNMDTFIINVKDLTRVEP